MGCSDIWGSFILPLFFTKNVTGTALEMVPGILDLLNTIGDMRAGGEWCILRQGAEKPLSHKLSLARVVSSP